MDLRDKYEWCNNITKYPLSSWDQPFWNKSNICWASLIDLCILPWQWSLEEDYLRGKWKIQRCLFFSLLFVCHFEKWDMIHPLWQFCNGCRWLKHFFVSLSSSWMENLFFLSSLYFSFFDSLFVCILKSGRWDGFLCDSFVMDADGERFLLVSPPDYKMKTDFSLICGSDKKGININMSVWS